jgi:hypothetical protein
MQRFIVAALALGLAVGGGWLVGSRSRTRAATQMTFVTHRTNLSFVTTAAGAVPYVTGPLSPGDRIVVSDDLLQGSTTIGSDLGVCTMTFDLNVLCDAAVTFTDQGEVHVSYAFQWPASAGATGPSSFDGVIEGGTLAFQDAHGSFHAVALPNGDYQFTATISDPAQ